MEKKRERVGSQWLSREMREASWLLSIYICYYTTYVVRYKLEKGGGQQRSKKAPLASSPPVINSR